jgi:hypothetical protein
MTLPSDFVFSQSSLQDYHDCQRRFQLRYWLRQQWPSVEIEPLAERERLLQQGDAFHQRVQQHLAGLPLAPLRDPDLSDWWAAFMEQGLAGLPEQRYAELQLSASLNGYPVLARYDLIAVTPGQQAVIVDWKTTQHRPGRVWLERRIQTRLYRYLFIRAGAHLNNGQPWQPEQLTMRYWFTAQPDQPEVLPYTRTQYAEDEDFLGHLMAQIDSQTDTIFPLTSEPKRCLYCTYRTLCERGPQAGNLSQAAGEDWNESADSLAPILELEF